MGAAVQDGDVSVITGQEVTWTLPGGQRLSLKVPGADSAMAAKGVLYVLVKDGGAKLPTRLVLIAQDGSELGVLNPEPGFSFYYLTPHPDAGVSIVCVTDTPINGWQDWHFAYNSGKKALVRLGPAY
ncbi:hypothetical protein [Nitrospirillum sp. BR 11163]|uniref:hypothetical protein n=1 Tax=Nitrospirillum sp. BR 11163 TaxID=3104323 RepID=UPI002AFE95D1|nr:hypothetical protein [Nitrospirillum sp. BR 11163]MEA1673571.1 hypothetical protein [Nitrospirillum sp. BR 11163]